MKKRTKSIMLLAAITIMLLGSTLSTSAATHSETVSGLGKCTHTVTKSNKVLTAKITSEKQAESLSLKINSYISATGKLAGTTTASKQTSSSLSKTITNASYTSLKAQSSAVVKKGTKSYNGTLSINY